VNPNSADQGWLLSHRRCVLGPVGRPAAGSREAIHNRKTTEKLHAIWSRTKGEQPLSGKEAEVFAITANGTRVPFDRIDPVPLTVEIKTGLRMILDYLLSPLLR
jgi:hypothetical protein